MNPNRALLKRMTTHADRMQAKAPDHLITFATFTREFAKLVDVTPVTIRLHLTEAVAEGLLLEILVRRDWLVVWPEHNSLPPMWATEDSGLHKLTDSRPDSRGSNNISFLMTPLAYSVFVERQRENLRARELAR